MEKLNLSNERIEITVLRNFIFNEAFTRKALPFCKEDYFTNRNERLLFREIDIFVNKYKNIPTKEALVIELGQRKDINEDEFKSVKELLDTLSNETVDLQWLLDTTEKFCKDRAVHNAVLTGIKILDKKDPKLTPEAIPGMASGVSLGSFLSNILIPVNTAL